MQIFKEQNFKPDPIILQTIVQEECTFMYFKHTYLDLNIPLLFKSN